MKKFHLIPSLFLFVVFIGSCTDDFITGNNMDKTDISSGYNVLPNDSLEIKYSMQSNPELMVADRIICNNSVFVLDLSLEEASELMIPKETYENALKQVEILNKTSGNN